MQNLQNITSDGCLVGATHCPSPNYDERAANTVVSLLVIHNISLPPGEYGGSEVVDFFQNNLKSEAHPYFEAIADIKVSAHLFIRRNGEVIQLVPFTKRAWHAGQSCFEGESACNNYSIGIEMEGTDTDLYTDQQYRSLISVTETLHQQYPGITAPRITGHEHIAPGRKTDPGEAFDWERYLTALSFNQEKLKQPPVQATLPNSATEVNA